MCLLHTSSFIIIASKCLFFCLSHLLFPAINISSTFLCLHPDVPHGRNMKKKMKKMNLFGYTYKIYDIGYKLEMMSKECNAGDPLETPGGLYRGPPSNENTIFKNMCMPNIQFKSVQCSFTMNVNQYSSSSRSVSSVLLVGFGLYDVLRRVSMAGCRRLLGLCGCGLKQITTNSSIYSFI